MGYNENAFLEFYVSIVAYTILHMIFVISSDFVEAFNIPPLNIGIYVDKLAAIRALLMVIADLIEWGITQKACNDWEANKSLLGAGTGGQGWFTMWEPREDWINSHGKPGARRWASMLSFVGMLGCRIAYLAIVYKSDNRSLSAFITLSIEGFWFGTFQMGFFAIGPEYNAYTSLGIHTMGNFIFFLQLILQNQAKIRPHINTLYRIRVHAWICLATSVLALFLWICFCLWETSIDEKAPSERPMKDYDVWSPFLLFIVGAFAEDFSVPGILPFAFLDPEKANLVNYMTPLFFMTGAMFIVLFNDWVNWGFKDWSAASAAGDGMGWHALWLLNLPKYIAFFISMWCIHGTYGRLRCIVQSRWRVMVLTMFVVVNRSTLEVAGYVGVANYAIGRGDSKLTKSAKLAEKLKIQSGFQSGDPLDKGKLANALNTDAAARGEVVELVKAFGVEVARNSQIGARADTSSNTVIVKIKGGGTATGTATVNTGSAPITIEVKGEASDLGSDNSKAQAIAKRLAKGVEFGKAVGSGQRNAIDGDDDYDCWGYIAYHDMLAMFCRFVYGKFPTMSKVGYN